MMLLALLEELKTTGLFLIPSSECWRGRDNGLHFFHVFLFFCTFITGQSLPPLEVPWDSRGLGEGPVHRQRTRRISPPGCCEVTFQSHQSPWLNCHVLQKGWGNELSLKAPGPHASRGWGGEPHTIKASQDWLCRAWHQSGVSLRRGKPTVAWWDTGSTSGPEPQNPRTSWSVDH